MWNLNIDKNVALSRWCAAQTLIQRITRPRSTDWRSTHWKRRILSIWWRVFLFMWMRRRSKRCLLMQTKTRTATSPILSFKWWLILLHLQKCPNLILQTSGCRHRYTISWFSASFELFEVFSPSPSALKPSLMASPLLPTPRPSLPSSRRASFSSISPMVTLKSFPWGWFWRMGSVSIMFPFKYASYNDCSDISSLRCGVLYSLQILDPPDKGSQTWYLSQAPQAVLV